MGELLSLWLLPHFPSSNGFDETRVFRDLKVIIEWAKNDYEVQILHLLAWLKRTRDISFSHIYRSFNHLVDNFLKKDIMWL